MIISEILAAYLHLFSKCLFMQFYYKSLIFIKLFKIIFIKSNLLDLFKGSNNYFSWNETLVLKTQTEYNWHLRKKGIFIYIRWFKFFILFLSNNTSHIECFGTNYVYNAAQTEFELQIVFSSSPIIFRSISCSTWQYNSSLAFSDSANSKSTHLLKEVKIYNEWPRVEI